MAAFSPDQQNRVLRGTPLRSSLRPGTLLVIGLLLLGLAAAGMAIWYQRAQTRRCLDFYGPVAARRLTKAPRVELWKLAPSGVAGRLIATYRQDVTDAKGIVHLRRGLVEDAGFRWADPGPQGALPAEAWDYALVFSDPAEPGEQTAVVVDIDPQDGWLAVAGRGGRVGLGRLGKGLRTWLAGAVSVAADPRP